MSRSGRKAAPGSQQRCIDPRGCSAALSRHKAAPTGTAHTRAKHDPCGSGFSREHRQSRCHPPPQHRPATIPTNQSLHPPKAPAIAYPRANQDPCVGSPRVQTGDIIYISNRGHGLQAKGTWHSVSPGPSTIHVGAGSPREHRQSRCHPTFQYRPATIPIEPPPIPHSPPYRPTFQRPQRRHP